MQTRLALAAVATLLVAAADIPANRRALDEARLFLSYDCEFASSVDGKSCRDRQDVFLHNYLRAMAGDTLSQKNLAFYFGENAPEVVAQSKVRSCAWAMIAQISPLPAEDGSPTDGMADRYCTDMSPNDWNAAKHLAEITSARIVASPAHMPHQPNGDTWPDDKCQRFTVAAAAQGRFAGPPCRTQAGQLDATVAPLVP